MVKARLTVAILGMLAGVAAAEPPRIALIYSDYGDFRHRDDYDARLADMGWPITKFENTQFPDVVGQLDSFDMMLGSALFNYSHVQDFSAQKGELLGFVRGGGAIILTDCNYPAHLNWLAGMGEGWGVTCRNTTANSTPMGSLEADHPIFTAPNRIASLGDCWAHMEVGEGWTALARSEEGGVTAAIREEGRGYLLLTSKWPHNEAMLENLWTHLQLRRGGILASLPELSAIRLGENALTSRLSNLTDQERSAAVEVCDEAEDREATVVRASAELKPHGRAVVELRLTVRERGAHSLKASVHAEGEPILECRPVSVVIPPLLSVEVLQPWYRGAIYAAAPPESLRLLLNAFPDPGMQLADLAAYVEAAIEGSAPVAIAPVKESSSEVRVPLPAAPENDISATVELRHGDEVIASERTVIPVVESRAEQVFLDDSGGTLIDGRPFFPVGIYHVGVEDFGRLPEMNFNTVVAWGSTLDGARQALATAGEAGLKVVLEMSRFLRGELDLAGFEEVVRGVEDHPALLAWYSVDEPSGNQVEWCEDAYESIVASEPHHPVYLVMCTPSAFAEFAPMTDILAVDPYPIPHAPIDMVASWMKRAQEAVRPGQPVWVIPQCHNWSAYREAGTGRGPTPEEERCMVYQGLIYGAKGVIYYPWDDGPTGLVHDPDLMEAVKQINAELQEIGPGLLVSERYPIADNEPTGLRAAGFVGRECSYVIATNTGPHPVEATLPLPGFLDGKVELMFEGAVVPAQDGRIRATIAPLAVHVYRVTQP